MAKVIAKGKLFGELCSVTATIENDKLKLRSPNVSSEVLEMIMGIRLTSIEPIGGTYYPEKDTLLAAYTVFTTNFFENTPEVTTSGEIGFIPQSEDDNAIY